MVIKILNWLLGNAYTLLYLYLLCIVINLTLLLLNHPHTKYLKRFAVNKLVIILLIIMCAVLDRLLPYLEINWHVTFIFTIMAITEEMLSIVTQASHDVNTEFLKTALKRLTIIIKQKTKI